MKTILALLLIAATTANADIGVVVSQSGTIIGKEAYAGDTSGVESALASRKQADPTLSFSTTTLPSPVFDAVVVPINQAKYRSDAVTQLVNDFSAIAKLIRAILLVLFDENNNTREWIQAFKAQVALSSSLADYKTRVATLPDMPDRTVQQAKTAVSNKINSGDSD